MVIIIYKLFYIFSYKVNTVLSVSNKHCDKSLGSTIIRMDCGTVTVGIIDMRFQMRYNPQVTISNVIRQHVSCVVHQLYARPGRYVHYTHTHCLITYAVLQTSLSSYITPNRTYIPSGDNEKGNKRSSLALIKAMSLS